uniref:Uncharacterized protein n=1 Tax=Anguilla anguilla TaxID=7936 RepID=A0A0E9PSQ3_ANGAN
MRFPFVRRLISTDLVCVGFLTVLASMSAASCLVSVPFGSIQHAGER